MGSPLSGINRCVRYTTLTCLLCQTLAYRVQQLVPLDVEGQEGPLLPTYDWVEQDILMSSSGWIEVHSNCLVSQFFRWEGLVSLRPFVRITGPYLIR